MTRSRKGAQAVVALLKDSCLAYSLRTTTICCTRCSRFMARPSAISHLPPRTRFHRRSYTSSASVPPASTASSTPPISSAIPQDAPQLVKPGSAVTREDAAAQAISSTSADLKKDRSAASEMPTFPVAPGATHTLFGGVILTRAPILTRDYTPFEEAFFLYQKRLNERLSLPFMPGIYFRPGTPAYMDWKMKIRERKMVPSREIGLYQRRGREAWNDEELVGSTLASRDHIYKVLLDDAVPFYSEEGELIPPEKRVRPDEPQSRRCKADEEGNVQRLDRRMDRTLYLIIQHESGQWTFPHVEITGKEMLHQTAARALREFCGENMHTWIIGRLPVAHVVINSTNGTGSATVAQQGKKMFYVKGRIMAGQADITNSKHKVRDFRWLTREELSETLDSDYFTKVKTMMADR